MKPVRQYTAPLPINDLSAVILCQVNIPLDLLQSVDKVPFEKFAFTEAVLLNHQVRFSL
jgi:hypothetical protein